MEVSSTEVRGKIMKNKKVLENHNNPILKNLRIKNMKTQEQINYEFATRQLLQMVPGHGAKVVMSLVTVVSVR